MSSVLDLKRINAEPSTVRGAAEVLTEAALDFLAELHERFDQRRRDLLEARAERQQRFDTGELPDLEGDIKALPFWFLRVDMGRSSSSSSSSSSS